MRIAIVHWSRRKAGGAESYLETIIPALASLGHEIAFWHEVDEPAGIESIVLPENIPVWCARSLGATCALQALRDWRPDLIYAHGVHDVELEAEVLRIAPVVFFVHTYYGACISGVKSFKFPNATPCGRRFGWPCLLHYYPRRCGGLNPATMWKDYRQQSRRLDLLRRCQTIVTSSSHMAGEYRRYGLTVHCTPLPVVSDDAPPVVESARTVGGWQILFLGRLEAIKGGHLLIDAAAQVVRRLQTPLRVVFAGEGPERLNWERRSVRRQADTAGLDVQFAGRVDRRQRDRLFAVSDLLAMPSLLPEPFGLSGPEAGLHGVPAVAFAVGGIPEWLTDGVNGHLAPANPPTAAGLADAITRCLIDAATHARLRDGATQSAQRFNMKNHLVRLEEIFGSTVRATTEISC